MSSIPTKYLHVSSNLQNLFASICHDAEWIEDLMRIELTRESLLVQPANQYAARDAQYSTSVTRVHGFHFLSSLGVIVSIDKAFQ